MARRRESPAEAPEGPGTRGAEAKAEPLASAPTPENAEPSLELAEGGRKVESHKPEGRPTTETWHPCQLTADRTSARSTPEANDCGTSRRGRWWQANGKEEREPLEDTTSTWTPGLENDGRANPPEHSDGLE